MDYRKEAKKSLDRAKNILQEGNKVDLKYVALELRMAFECLVYDRAGLFNEELSNKKLSTWQPRQLLSLLMEIDPDADKSCSIRAGLQKEIGKPADRLSLLGNERVLSLSEIKKYYDRLGSYLHAPTIEQVIEKKGATPEKIKTRCNEIIEILDEVLSSPIFNVNFRSSSSICCERCQAKIVRRMPYEAKTVIARCIECSASYQLTSLENNKVEWMPLKHKVKCAEKTCGHINKLWVEEFKLDNSFSCSSCGKENQFVLGVMVKNS
jgi:hypothetical protein